MSGVGFIVGILDGQDVTMGRDVFAIDGDIDREGGMYLEGDSEGKEEGELIIVGMLDGDLLLGFRYSRVVAEHYLISKKIFRMTAILLYFLESTTFSTKSIKISNIILY